MYDFENKVAKAACRFSAAQVNEHHAKLARNIPLGRVARADEVAAGILWLCSDAS